MRVVKPFKWAATRTVGLTAYLGSRHSLAWLSFFYFSHLIGAEMQKQTWLYVLKLTDGKYYVGKTTRKFPDQRIKEHIAGFYTSQWVKKYPFKELVQIVNLGTIDQIAGEEAEQKLTLELMKRYGFQNVRGGRLNYSGKYIRVFDRYFRENDFQLLLSVLFMTGVIIFLGFKVLTD